MCVVDVKTGVLNYYITSYTKQFIGLDIEKKKQSGIMKVVLTKLSMKDCNSWILKLKLNT